MRVSDVLQYALPVLPIAALAVYARVQKGRVHGARPSGPVRTPGRVLDDPLSPGHTVGYRLPDGSERTLTVRGAQLRPGQRVAVVVDPAHPEGARLGPRHQGLGWRRTLLLIAGVFLLLGLVQAAVLLGD